MVRVFNLYLQHYMKFLFCRCINAVTKKLTCNMTRADVCDQSVDCTGLSPCDMKCSSTYKCKSGACVGRDSVCDGVFDNMCPEDDEWQSGVGFKCVRKGKICKLPQQLLRDDVADCDNGEDLCSSLQNTAESRYESQQLTSTCTHIVWRQ